MRTTLNIESTSQEQKTAEAGAKQFASDLDTFLSENPHLRMKLGRAWLSKDVATCTNVFNMFVKSVL